MTLAILDDLTPGNLTGGMRVAVTGTIDSEGNVGEIGGIEQKAVAARAAHVKLFIVPQCSPSDPPPYLASCKADLVRTAKRAGQQDQGRCRWRRSRKRSKVLRAAGGAPVPTATLDHLDDDRRLSVAAGAEHRDAGGDFSRGPRLSWRAGGRTASLTFGGMGVPMNESDRRQRVISSAPRLSTDEVANHSFAEGRAGLQRDRSPRVPAAGRRGARRSRAAASTSSRPRSTRSRNRSARPGRSPSRSCSTRSGEETARLLRSAREASDDIRKKAEERATRPGRGRGGGRGSAPAPRPPSCSRRAPPKPRPRPPSSSRAAEARADGRARAARSRRRRRSSTARGAKVATCSTRRRPRASACSAISCAAGRCRTGRSRRCARGATVCSTRTAP